MESRNDAESVSLRHGTSPQSAGLEAQTEFLAKCRQSGRDVHAMPYMWSFDALVDSWRVEIKSALARRNKRGGPIFWTFNIHRRGKLIETCDFYAVKLETRWLLFRAPLGVYVLRISAKQLTSRYTDQIEAMQAFERGDFGLGPTEFDSLARTCEICESKFMPERSNQATCSQSCSKIRRYRLKNYPWYASEHA